MPDDAPKADSIVAPLAVEVTRGAVVESRHRASAVVTDAKGRIVRRWGDIDQAVFPRSAIKSLQALPLIETGAADRYGLGDGEIALACASHGAEDFHTETIDAWLARIGLAESDLECGAHPPIHAPTMVGTPAMAPNISSRRSAAPDLDSGATIARPSVMLCSMNPSTNIEPSEISPSAYAAPMARPSARL